MLFTGIQAVKAQNRQAPAADPLAIPASHDFGIIRQGRPVTSDIFFTNIGKEPLKIENIAASCGCTTPKWSTDPIMPGAKAYITVGYNAAAEGQFEKSVTVFYNGGKSKTFFIRGEVSRALPPAPANSSVQLLKQ